MVHTDQEIVAAFNSCIDLDKYKSLPLDVRKRIAELLNKRRMKVVCFMEQCGLGLKMFQDSQFVGDDGDEVEEMKSGQKATVDTKGSYLRCPGSLYKKEEKYLIINSRATRYFGMKPGNTYDSTAKNIHCMEWKGSRSLAVVFAYKEDATEIAKECDGIVVEA